MIARDSCKIKLYIRLFFLIFGKKQVPKKMRLIFQLFENKILMKCENQPKKVPQNAAL